ncbi:recombinase family protein [Streptomyces sp. NPDC002514]|uniref:recombinase family protein n=1 Tax=Streptomyces sp. NPDC001270 TaxID=3364554 RepID=UPI0036B73159
MSDLPEPSGHPELLVAEPLVRTEIKIRYARLSTGGQKLERQIDALTAAGCRVPGAGCRVPGAGCRKIFSDKKSGKTDLRTELKACHAVLNTDDTPVVPSLDRYGRSLQDLINMVAALRRREIGLTSRPSATYCPTPAAPSPRSSSCLGSPRARSTTTFPTSRNCGWEPCPTSFEATLVPEAKGQ